MVKIVVFVEHTDEFDLRLVATHTYSQKYADELVARCMEESIPVTKFYVTGRELKVTNTRLTKQVLDSWKKSERKTE